MKLIPNLLPCVCNGMEGRPFQLLDLICKAHLAKSRSIFNRMDKVTVDGILYEEEEDIKAQACLYFTRQASGSSSILDESFFDISGPSLNEA